MKRWVLGLLTIVAALFAVAISVPGMAKTSVQKADPLQSMEDHVSAVLIVPGTSCHATCAGSTYTGLWTKPPGFPYPVCSKSSQPEGNAGVSLNCLLDGCGSSYSYSHINGPNGCVIITP